MINSSGIDKICLDLSNWSMNIAHKAWMSSLVLSALLVCSLIPIHDITTRLALRKLSATDVNPLADPAPSPYHGTHGTGGLSPPEQKNGGLLWGAGNQTFLIQWGERPAGSFSTLETCALCKPTVLENKAEAALWSGMFGSALGAFTFIRAFFLLSALLLPCCLSNKPFEG